MLRECESQNAVYCRANQTMIMPVKDERKQHYIGPKLAIFSIDMTTSNGHPD